MGFFSYFKKEKSHAEQYSYSRGIFRIVVEDTFTIAGRGTVIVGKIAEGTVSVGDEVTLQRVDGSSRSVVITGIESYRKLKDSATAGENVGLLLRGITKADIGKGDILKR